MIAKKKNFQQTVDLIYQVLQIKDWDFIIGWTKDETAQAGSHIFTMRPDEKKCLLYCNEAWLVDSDKIVKLIDIALERLVELATYELQVAIEQQKQILKKIVKGIALPS